MTASVKAALRTTGSCPVADLHGRSSKRSRVRSAVALTPAAMSRRSTWIGSGARSSLAMRAAICLISSDLPMPGRPAITNLSVPRATSRTSALDSSPCLRASQDTLHRSRASSTTTSGTSVTRAARSRRLARAASVARYPARATCRERSRAPRVPLPSANTSRPASTRLWIHSRAVVVSRRVAASCMRLRSTSNAWAA